MTELKDLSVEQLRRALSIKEQIEGLQAQLTAITGDGAAAPVETAGDGESVPKARRKISDAWRAKIAAAARARWRKARAAGRNAL